MIRLFTMQDYDEVYKLWKKTVGVGLRSLDDSKEGIDQFVRRNPNTNFVAMEEGQIVGVVLSGHDGRRGYLYHACVKDTNRRRSIGRHLIEQVVEAMKKENITKLALICFSHNEQGNEFWRNMGWNIRKDLNYYTISINDNND